MNIINNINTFLFSKKALPILIAVMSVGLILAVFSDSFLDKEVKTNKEDEAEIQEAVVESESDFNSDEAENLKHILSCIKNVGDVDVQIVYKSSSEKVPLKLNDQQGNVTTVMENENSKSSPFIIKENTPQIEGIIIVAAGAEDIALKAEIITAVSDVYNLPMHKVKVFDMK